MPDSQKCPPFRDSALVAIHKKGLQTAKNVCGSVRKLAVGRLLENVTSVNDLQTGSSIGTGMIAHTVKPHHLDSDSTINVPLIGCGVSFQRSVLPLFNRNSVWFISGFSFRDSPREIDMPAQPDKRMAASVAMSRFFIACDACTGAARAFSHCLKRA